ncbi:MAG: aldehyde dehydrogenase family protein [Chitinophagales bacterium]|nr:aldehyde dehydrogenase family protein [Chitinophagales bacterium]MDW8428518.1 aldehyde dehydrogenase family protein [Chitinophagales bacterium]
MLAAETTQAPSKAFLEKLQIEALCSGACTGTRWLETDGPEIASVSPTDGQHIATVRTASRSNYEAVIQVAEAAFRQWRTWPAPKRGEVVRQMGEQLRLYKEPLGMLVSYEMGKSYQEGLGEVQEMIDICDFAVGLSRQLYGLTMPSERPQHRMFEQWHPLGIVGVITAFNFPVAVWSWNAMIALVCGDVVVWKPSSKTMLCAIAVHKLLAPVLQRNNVPEGVINLIAGSSQAVGDALIDDIRIPLISATGSTRMGKQVAQRVAARLGRTILELGGNNAIIISAQANLDLALRATTFGAVGTCGQRCTTTRRLIVQDVVYEEVKQRLVNIYRQLRIGNPLDPQNHVGPLIDQAAVQEFVKAIEEARQQGGNVLIGGEVLEGPGYESGCYVSPCIIEMPGNTPIVQRETFAPILYLMKYRTLQEAIDLQNGVPQGLSSAIFTDSVREMEFFLSVEGSDCGIANVNIGTSGAEIGGAFGGEKETGGGRESGSDAWKQYMRRQTNTINFGTALPLAQGIQFNI